MDKEQIKRKIIDQIILCGESIINNAENIAGNYEYRAMDHMHISFDVRSDEVPTINVDVRFIPEGICKKY